eukprot:c14574_g1_i1.p1 GENE.c14574_g1_i1~~c14574_g1_i1.p1  ORF type:complete len:196 (-),score=71.02 c14574_g1_i1:44-631(-)
MSNNKFFFLRHGQSEANVAGIIVSSDEGIDKYGLTEIGKEQVLKSSANAKSILTINDIENLVIVSSNFKRANETAKIFHSQINPNSPFLVDSRLRERFFGEFDLKTNEYYENVWESDKNDANHTKNGVESVQSVRNRCVELVNELNQKFQNKCIVLVAHGDTLQIGQTYFSNVDPNLHRSLPHFQTAEFRFVGSK